VLKPAAVLGGQAQRPAAPLVLHMEVISAHYLPPDNASCGEIIDPFVIVWIAGHKEDSTKYEEDGDGQRLRPTVERDLEVLNIEA